MADIKISALPTATTPLTGAELVPIVQGGVTKQTTTSDVLAVPVTSLTASSAVATDASKKLVSVANTGTGDNVLATSPTLVTPILGTPQSVTLTNATGLPLTTGVTGLLPVANGGTGTATPALVAGSNVSITGSWPNQTINSSAPGTGTVTSVSVVSANGLAGTVANATTTPAITLSTSVTGVVKGNGTTLSAATAGTDYVAPGGALGTPSSGTVTNLTGTASININGTVGATTPAAVSATSLTDSGNLTFTGTGNRITGDFSNATPASRVMFQTSTVNNQTLVAAIPNGTSVTSQFNVFNNSDATNASRGVMAISATDVNFQANITGTGTYLPMIFYTGGSERVRIDTAGAVTIPGTLSLTGASSTLGYGTGSGGTVTQATSRTTAVTLNKPTGQITMFTAVGSATPAFFAVNNSLVSASDVIIVSLKSGALNNYVFQILGVSAGQFVIQFHSQSGTLSDTPVLNFAVIKGSTS